jgi:mono/diheme cytochrome c family protein
VSDDGPELAGGRAIRTPFGIYYSTNITPDPRTGLGAWSEAEFVEAMTQGIAPDGSHYFPVFPYTSFAGMTEGDLRDLWAWLSSRPPVVLGNRAHAAPPPFRWRFGVAAWKWLYFDPRPLEPDASRSSEWNRGRYLGTALGHCGECHTPRTLSGAPDPERPLAGSADGPEGELAPNITPDPETGIGRWSTPDLVWFLQTGLRPDGDATQGLMSELIDHGYRYLSPADLNALAVWLQSQPPIRNELKPSR